MNISTIQRLLYKYQGELILGMVVSLLAAILFIFYSSISSKYLQQEKCNAKGGVLIQDLYTHQCILVTKIEIENEKN